MLIDTHAHVNFGAFTEDAEPTIKRALQEGVSVINVGTQIDTSREAVAMAERFEQLTINNLQLTGKVYAVVGIHPVHTYSQELDEEETHFKTREEKFDYVAYKELASHPKVVGIGECGLDYFRLPQGGDHQTVKKMQADAFIEQVKLAKELNKTLVIHSRSSKGTDDACLDILEILKSFSSGRHSEAAPGFLSSAEESQTKKEILRSDALPQDDADGLPRFVLHSYTGSPKVAKLFVDFGAYISFNGIITFDKTGNQEAVLKVVPDDKIVLETDCPYLTPVPHRGRRNEPAYVKHVAEHIAKLKNLSFDELANLTTANAKKLFNI